MSASSMARHSAELLRRQQDFYIQAAERLADDLARVTLSLRPLFPEFEDVEDEVFVDLIISSPRTVDAHIRDLAAPAAGENEPGDADSLRRPAPSGRFFIGDRVRVVLEGTLTGFNREDGHYYLKGNSLGADHIDWLHRLHWATEFEVLQEGPRNLGDGATTADAAFAADPDVPAPTTSGGAS